MWPKLRPCLSGLLWNQGKHGNLTTLKMNGELEAIGK